jgi:hypothetical protein
VVDAGEVDELLVAVLEIVQQQDPADLGHARG